MMKLWRYWFGVAAAALLGLAGAAGAADRLTLTDKSEHDGTFDGYGNGRFEFTTTDGERLREPHARVAELTVSPPVAARVKRRGGKDLDGAVFSGYRGQTFYLTHGGESMALPGLRVAAIQPEADFKRAMQHVGDADAGMTLRDADLASLVATGQTTVIHFHMASVAASVRQGNYLQALAAKHKADTRFVRVTLADWNDPAARKFGITSVPQFWFYDDQGALSAKLVDRFTTDDLETALRAARR